MPGRSAGILNAGVVRIWRFCPHNDNQEGPRMRLSEREFDFPGSNRHSNLIAYIAAHPRFKLVEGAVPLRFVVTSNIDGDYHCELGILEYGERTNLRAPESIFTFRPRRYENQ